MKDICILPCSHTAFISHEHMVFVMSILHVTGGTQIVVCAFHTFPAKPKKSVSTTFIAGDALKVYTWKKMGRIHFIYISAIFFFFYLCMSANNVNPICSRKREVFIFIQPQ